MQKTYQWIHSIDIRQQMKFERWLDISFLLLRLILNMYFNHSIIFDKRELLNVLMVPHRFELLVEQHSMELIKVINQEDYILLNRLCILLFVDFLKLTIQHRNSCKPIRRMKIMRANVLPPIVSMLLILDHQILQSIHLSLTKK